jgi:hypothetical protein
MKEKNEMVLINRDGRDLIIHVSDITIDDFDFRCPSCLELVRPFKKSVEYTDFDHYEHASRGGIPCPFKTFS